MIFLALACEALSDADLEACIALSQTGQGRVLNDSIFTAFHDMNVGISRDTGLRAARFMTLKDI